MKILLIYPYCLEQRYYEENISAPPMGLYYLGALLKENRFDVEILNFYDLRDEPDTIESILRKAQADVIGFSTFNANRWGAIEIATIAKRIDPTVQIVFGGVAATHLWEHFLTHFPQIDFVVLGEAEYSFLQLIRIIEKKEFDHVAAIKGIAFRQGAAIIKTDPAPFIQNLDELPNPARYFTYQYLALTRGCPANCTFCGSPQFWKRRVRWHSADYFVSQLELLYRRGVSFFYFSDDTFTLKKGVVIDICRKILAKRLNISWYAISRVDCIDEEILYWMRSAGCIQISYGVESGSAQIRKLLNKDISIEQIKSAFSLTTSYGILARAYFIYGCPGETADTITQTMDLIKEIKPLSVIFYVLRLFPGTALYLDLQRNGQISDDLWLERVEDVPYYRYDLHLSEKQVSHFGEELRKSYYRLLPSIVNSLQLKDLKELYPLHADFCSRLAMTFSHGDYSQIEAIPDKNTLATQLYQKALRYYPNHRAYLGLGILNQLSGKYRESIKVLSEGVSYFPNSETLHICLAVNSMNLSKYDEALAILSKFPESPQANKYMADCYKALGDYRNESLHRDKSRLPTQ